MTPTVTDVYRTFRTLNKLYFDNKLKLPKIELTQSKKHIAKCVAYPNKKKKKLDLATFYVSTMFDYPEKMFNDIIAHEMIHLYIYQNFIKDNGGHGDEWKRIAALLNDNFDFNITETIDASAYATYDTETPSLWKNIKSLFK